MVIGYLGIVNLFCGFVGNFVAFEMSSQTICHRVFEVVLTNIHDNRFVSLVYNMCVVKEGLCLI